MDSSFVFHSTTDGATQIINTLSEPVDSHSFPIETELPLGSTWRKAENGSLSLIDSNNEHLMFIDEPWSIDAAGKKASNEFSIDGDTITQHVDTSAAVFPVVSDPSFWWYTKNAATCITSIAAFGFGTAKLAQVGLKVWKKLKGAKAGTKLYSVFQNYKKLGTTNSARMKALLIGIKAYAVSASKYGVRKAGGIIRSKGGRNSLALSVLLGGAGVLSDALGFSSCASLVTGRN